MKDFYAKPTMVEGYVDPSLAGDLHIWHTCAPGRAPKASFKQVAVGEFVYDGMRGLGADGDATTMLPPRTADQLEHPLDIAADVSRQTLMVMALLAGGYWYFNRKK